MNNSLGASAAQPRATTPASPSSPPAVAVPPHAVEPLEWYYARDGQTFGPFARTTLLDLFATKELSIECYIWHQTFAEWQPAYATPPFADAIANLRREQTDRSPSPAPSSPDPDASSRLQSLFSRASSPPPDDEIDLDVDGASRVINFKDIRNPTSDLASSDDEIDLDIDGASRVVRVQDIRPPAGRHANVSIDLDVDGNSGLLNTSTLGALSTNAHHSNPPPSARNAADILAELHQIQDEIHAREASSPRSFSHDDHGGGEQSMLIQIDLLRAQQRQARMRTLGIAVGVGLGVFLLVFTSLKLLQDPEPDTRPTYTEQTRDTSLGQGLSEDQLLALAPESDFEIVSDASSLPDPIPPSPESGIASDLIDSPPSTPDNPQDPTSAKPDKTTGKPSTKPDKNPDAKPDKTKKPNPLPNMGSTTDPLNIDLNAQDGTSARNGVGLGTKDDTKPKVGGPSSSLPTSSDPLLSSRRKQIDIGDGSSNPTAALSTGQKAPSISQKDRTLFKSGITKIANSVHLCSRRFADKVGTTLPERITIRLTVSAEGALEKVKTEGSFPDVFLSCLKDQEIHWKFAPRPGGASVEFRQAFLISK